MEPHCVFAGRCLVEYWKSLSGLKGATDKTAIGVLITWKEFISIGRPGLAVISLDRIGLQVNAYNSLNCFLPSEHVKGISTWRVGFVWVDFTIVPFKLQICM
jgi:hypothetical protein